MLKLSEGLSLPLDAATRRLAILAMSGAGKSNAAVVLAEAMFDAGIPWVAIDPKGDWWGIRSNKTGKGPGLPIPIFGGLHADVPLEPTAAAGKELAEAIVAQRITCVVDISEFTDRQAMWGFLTTFGDTLLQRNRQVLHLFLEEADEYLPQKTSEKGNLPKCLGVWQRVVKRGRFRGLGSTQITQRSAALNKDTLYQAEALIAMRASGKGDRDAVKGWVEHHNAAEEIVASLPTLKDGEAWLSSPAWLRQTVRVQFARRRTFDSGSTPVLLTGNAKPATLATIDLDVLRKSMATAIEKAKADDPAELRKTIELLQREKRSADQRVTALEHGAAKLQPAKRVDVPVVTDKQLQQLEALVGRVEQAIARAGEVLTQPTAKLRGQLQDLVAAVRSVKQPSLPMAPTPIPGVQPRAFYAPQRTTPAPRPRAEGEGAGVLNNMTRAFLIALAQHPDGLSKKKLLVHASYRSSGKVSSAFAAMGRDGWVTGDGDRLVITDLGLQVLGPFDPLPTGAALRDQALRDNKLSTPAKAILRVLFEDYPNDIGKADILVRANYASSGKISSAFAHLVAIDYAEQSGSGRLRAAAVFFEEA